MKITPLNERVLIRRDQHEGKIGSIIIPDNAKERLTRGTVMAVGPGKLTESGERRPMSVKVGDKVLFGKYSGSEVEQDSEERIFMSEDDILATVEDE